MRSRLFAVLAASCVLLSSSPILSMPGADTVSIADTPEVLKNIGPIRVGIGELGAESKELGVDRQTITTDVELKLREASIPIIPESVKLSDTENTLWVTLYSLKIGPKDIYAITIAISLETSVRLVSDPSRMIIGASLWRRHYLGYSSKLIYRETVRGYVKDAVEAFMNDYLKANPKK